MSTVPNVVPGSEPQPAAAPPTGVASEGTAAGVTAPAVDLNQYVPKDQAEQWHQDAERLKGFQGDYTWMAQSGVLDEVKRLRQQSRDPATFKQRMTELESAASIKQQVDSLGGLDALQKHKVAYDVLYGSEPVPAAEPNVAPMIPQVQPQPTLNAEQVRQIIREEYTTIASQESRAAAMKEMAEAVAEDAGLVPQGSTPDSYVTSLIQSALESDLQTITQGARDPLPEEIGAAGQRVMEKFINPIRASGTALATGQTRPSIPPLQNARGPGGTQPPPDVTKMTPEQRRMLARQMAEQHMADQTGLPSPPKTFNDGIHSFE